MVWYLQFDKGFLKGGEHAEIAATGTPVGIDFPFQIGKSQLTCSLCTSGH
jgi:hypothetical protein